MGGNEPESKSMKMGSAVTSLKRTGPLALLLLAGLRCTDDSMPANPADAAGGGSGGGGGSATAGNGGGGTSSGTAGNSGASGSGGATSDAGTDAPVDAGPGLQKINHIVVIYLENWSFDSLYGEFAGAEGLSSAAAMAAPKQLDKDGNVYATP